MRVYVPATLPLLATWLREGAVSASTAHAAVPALREWYAEGDDEELEFSALLDAAGSSLDLLAQDPHAPRRRTVVAADVPDAGVRALGTPADDEPPSRVALSAPVPMTAVVSVHVDEEEAEATVQAAVAALPAARAGDEDAQFVVDGAEDGDLLWYDVTEAADLVG